MAGLFHDWVNVFVRCFINGVPKVETMLVNRNSGIGIFREAVSIRAGIPVVYRKRMLKDDETLKTHGIVEGDEILAIELIGAAVLNTKSTASSAAAGTTHIGSSSAAAATGTTHIGSSSAAGSVFPTLGSLPTLLNNFDKRVGSHSSSKHMLETGEVTLQKLLDLITQGQYATKLAMIKCLFLDIGDEQIMQAIIDSKGDVGDAVDLLMTREETDQASKAAKGNNL